MFNSYISLGKWGRPFCRLTSSIDTVATWNPNESLSNVIILFSVCYSVPLTYTFLEREFQVHSKELLIHSALSIVTALFFVKLTALIRMFKYRIFEGFVKSEICHLIEESKQKTEKFLIINAAIIVPERDLQLFSRVQTYQQYESIAEKYQVQEMAIRSATDVERIKLIPDSISGIVINSHGFESGIRLSEECWLCTDEYTKAIHLSGLKREARRVNKRTFQFFAKLKHCLRPNSLVVLTSCLAGKGESSFASFISKILGSQVRVIAPKDTISSECEFYDFNNSQNPVVFMKKRDALSRFHSRRWEDITAVYINGELQRKDS